MKPLTPKDLGAIVREARRRDGLTQTQLGQKIGASRFWVAEFERGKSGAELGLTLKALRALKLELVVRPANDPTRGEPRDASSGGRVQVLSRADLPAIDLAALLRRTASPDTWTQGASVTPDASLRPRKARKQKPGR